MKTTQHTTRWLGLALACGTLAFTLTTQAAKPIKPPPPPPPPSGPAYQIIAVDGAIKPWSISDSGTLVGSAFYEWDGGGFYTPAALPANILNGEVQYLAADLRLLADADGTQEFGDCVAMNAAGLAVGFVDDIGPVPRAILWLPDGTPLNLGADPAGLGSSANDINDAGLVLIGVGHENEPGEMGGVVVPLDMDSDGQLDTWFTDVDADGINDLLFPFDAGHNLLSPFINEAGQVAVAQGYLLTPDLDDPDGDGNPWFADVNADGFNDLLVALQPPVPGVSVAVNGLNNLGQVVGNSGGHVVRWEFVDGVQIVTDLGSLSDKSVMTVAGISDSGRIVGASKIPVTSWKSKDGPSWLIENDTMYELLPLVVNPGGWTYLEANGINRDGWIQGLGILDGSWRRFVAIPVDEP